MMMHRLTIKGGPDDEAVLCTSAATYAIKYVSTSNTVLLIPPSEKITNGNNDDGMGFTMAQVVATSSGHLELVETAPQLDNLKTLLNQRPYVEDLEGGQVREEANSYQGLIDFIALVTQGFNCGALCRNPMRRFLVQKQPTLLKTRNGEV
jgi:sister chromatid cohesion protein DCC1